MKRSQIRKINLALRKPTKIRRINNIVFGMYKESIIEAFYRQNLIYKYMQDKRFK